MIYLDNSSTTRPYDEVIDLMDEIMRDDFGNASSLHRVGFSAETRLRKARDQVAEALGSDSSELIFTSGGSESDNTALLCGAYSRRRYGRKVIASCVEHPAVLESLKRLEAFGYETVLIPVDKNGVIDMDRLESEIDDQTILISCMHVNNETGAIQPIQEIARIKGNALFHVDMVQSFGKLEIPLQGIDMASISGHKIHGPKGVGILYIRRGLNIPPFVVGGGQEKGMRSGTENIAGDCGLGLAAHMIYKDREAKNASLRAMKKAMADIFENNLDGVLINSTPQGAPHILNVTFEGTRGEVLLHMLEQQDVYVSTGSACSSNKKSLSHVLKAMGRTDRQVEATIRFSLCDQNTMEEVTEAAEKTVDAVRQFRKLGKFR